MNKVVLKDKQGNEKTWFRVDFITLLMRKTYGFRMIGKFLYCTPIRNSK